MDSDKTAASWIGAEACGGQLRLWWIDDGDRLIAAETHKIAEAGPEAKLQSLLAGSDLPVLRSGWPDAPLRPVPAAIPAPQNERLPGLVQDRPAALIRAEATRIAGFLAVSPDFDGVICLIGAQSVWAHISAGEIVSFRPFLTPRLLRQLSAQPDAPAITPDIFAASLESALSRPAAIAAELASVDAALDLGRIDAAGADTRRAGLLIGIELAAARPYWLGQQVALIGTGGFSDAYDAALRSQGVVPLRADRDRMTLAGLTKARRR